MWNEPQRKLAVRTGFAIAVQALLLSVFLAFLSYVKTYDDEVEGAKQQLQQLFGTVAQSAAIAAYLGDEVLAKEVGSGLAGNDIVAGLIFTSSNGKSFSSGMEQDKEAVGIPFKLYSPFDAKEEVGTIRIFPNQQLIERNARAAALDHVAMMIILSVLLVALVMVSVHRQLTRPLLRVVRALHKINPGNADILTPPEKHEEDEIGLLVSDINSLLVSVSSSLEKERNLRSDIELLARRFRLIFENSSSGIVLAYPDGRIEMYNAAFAAMLGEDRMNELLGGNNEQLTDLFSNADELLDAMHQSIDNHGIGLDLRLRDTEASLPTWLHGLFSPVYDESDTLMIACIMYDVTERALYEKQMRQEAEHDPLTGLMNRRACERMVTQVLKQAEAASREVAIMLIDLDHFKPINDRLGHDAGDAVLKTVASRLQESVRGNDLIIRWGGDEFIVVAAKCREDFQFESIAHRLLERVNKPIQVNDKASVTVGVSIGMAVYPEHGHEFKELIRLADEAMYYSKKISRNTFTVYGPGLTIEAS